MIFYKPIKKYIAKKDEEEQYHDILGTQAICETNLVSGCPGYIKWSGSVCRAILTIGRADKGDPVKITGVSGNIFIVKKMEDK